MGVKGCGKALAGAKTLVIAGIRGNAEDPGGMVEAIGGRFDAMGGKAEAMLAIGGGRLATIGGRPLDGLALDSGPDRLPGWQSTK